MRRSAKAVGLAAALGCLLAAGPRAARGAEREYADTHPETGVSSVRVEGGRIVEAAVPGTLLDWAAPRAGDEPPQVYLLAAAEMDPERRRTLYRARLDAGTFEVVADGLPSALDSLEALDLDGDGRDELLLGEPGRVHAAVPRGRGRPLGLAPAVAAPGLDLRAALLSGREGSGIEGLVFPTLGALLPWTPGASSPGAAVTIPRRAARHQHGLRMTSPATTLLRPSREERLLAVGPEAVGDHRLRSLLIQRREPAGGREVWSRLPGPERLQWSWFRVLDGRPVLLVTTNSAERLGVLERQQLRLFSLYGDRTRAGVGPWLTARTASRRWQRVEPWITDVDGDGDEDLVVAQVAGLGGGEIELEAFLNGGSKNFLPATRSTRIDRAADGWHFGDDLSGDGLPDLVLATDGALEIFPNLEPGRSRLVASRPERSFPGSDIPRGAASIELGPGGVAVVDPRSSRIGAPWPLDLDGDGRAEIVLAENPRWGFGRLRVVFLDPR